VGVVAAIAGIVLLTQGHGDGTVTGTAPTTSAGFGPIPGDASTTTDPGAPLGPGAFCAELDRLAANSGAAQWFLQHDDLDGLRSVTDTVGDHLGRLARRAPTDVRGPMDTVNTDMQNLVALIDRASSAQQLRIDLADQIPPIIRRNLPLLHWTDANCPKVPTVSTPS
jgi:hypothetical protein